MRLLFWPAELSSDYSYPRTQLVTSINLPAVIGALVVLSMIAVAWQARRTAPVVTFGALWMAITLAIPSNLFLLTGFVLAERALFLPSVGAVVGVSAAIFALARKVDRHSIGHRALVGSTVVLMACGLVRSAERNPVWRDNETLFRQTVKDVPMSSRAHWMLSEHFARTGRPESAADEITRAVLLGRMDDFILLTAAADQMQSSGMCSRAMPFYDRALAVTPQNEKLRANAALCLVRLGLGKQAKALVQAGLSRNPESARLDGIVAMVDSLEAAAR